MQENRAASRFLPSAFDEESLRETVESARRELGGDPSVIFAHVSSDWLPYLKEAVEIIRVFGHARHVIGSTAEGFVGVGVDSERVSGCSLLFLRLPGTRMEFLKVKTGEVESFVGDAGSGAGVWLALCNPYLAHGERWMQRWNLMVGDAATYGGLASGISGAEGTAVFLDAEWEEMAAVAVRFSGGIQVRGVVSQGCRPIGLPYTVTGVRQNVVTSIGSRQAFKVLEEAFQDLNSAERQSAPGNLFAGLALSEYREDFGRGDFLVRNILGADPERGVALGAFPRSGQTLQFQVRDKETADADLRRLCLALGRTHERPFAGMLFSCLGRGSRMFGVPNHDARVIEEVLGKIPLGGFLGNGEIGPVGGRNYLHGYTASTAFFYAGEGAEENHHPA
ncbi:MAG: FIST C-terminal domain-containing protein [Verrucomicrobia bacterium]|nr:FIST C-terminal domain-containing protein [Verrucomicrobiota bacterium]